MTSTSTEQSVPWETEQSIPRETAVAVTPSLGNSVLHEDLPLLVDDETHNNFPEWHLKVYILLQTWGILKYIEGPESARLDIPVLRESVITSGYDKDNVLTEVRTVGNADEYNRKMQVAKPWIEGNDLVLAKLLKALPLSQLREFKDERYAKAVWTGLREFYLPLNIDRMDTIKSNIGSNKCSPEMDIDQWLHEMKQSFDTLTATDEQLMSKREFTLTILRNMPKTDAWRVAVNGYKAQITDYDKRGVPIKPTKFISKILDENWLYTKDNPQSSNYVFAARSEANKRAQKQKTTEPSSSGPAKRTCTKPEVTSDKGQACPNCSKEGLTCQSASCRGGEAPVIIHGGGKVLGTYTSLPRSATNTIMFRR
jgi:hypothetical protein